ncbi:transglutaminase [Methylobacterium sp. Leaf399]|uniref:transglutaminase-like domain-containing protein n=1 Tax=unclassified Methylobacterium TaxID=2615210 RepID=UPI000701B646|nr:MULTISPECIES: transglutaminase family protein [unclassified Methylobacterium]KQP55028.1 transglutaminase [Methylobacterium sp. Leaf108]KQT09077.1 transglutaminase [Methylobacterium sp. Leaf399]KQT79001.1 transglutaminase [Methylobacterium sp. Leaf466]
MRYELGCSLSYNILSETVFIFNVEVAHLQSLEILSEALTLAPDLPRRTYVTPDLQNRYLGVVVQPGPFSLEYNATVDLTPFRADPATIGETPVNRLPLDILPFLLPSRYVSSDRLTPFAVAEFGALPKGHQRVNAICSWIHTHITYQAGTSDAETTADESLLRRAGVCRDFAHLGIAFCRALGIPARFVSAYAHGLVPSDFHAVFEAYLDGRWWLFDATRQANLDGLVRIGVGRDAAEIAFSTPFGNMQPTAMQVRIARSDGVSDAVIRTVDAISTEIPAPHAGAA